MYLPVCDACSSVRLNPISLGNATYIELCQRKSQKKVGAYHGH